MGVLDTLGDAHRPMERAPSEGGASAPPMLTVRSVRKWFRGGTELGGLLGREGTVVRAVDDVSFDVRAGEILGLVGESGSGKTTLGRLIVGLETPDAGQILLGDGRDVTTLRGRERRRLYRDVQMVFQDPYESINPRFTVNDTVAEPLRAQGLARGAERRGYVLAALERAGLRPPTAYVDKYPHELSGGERQRVSIARALVVEPRLLIADEPVSMLDVSIRAGILNLLRRLSRELGLTILYVSHDLSTTRYVCDRIVIMYRGTFVEVGDSEQVIDAPRHPYAQTLRAAIPVPDPEIARERPDADDSLDEGPFDPRACRYVARCPHAMAVCRERIPAFRATEPGHTVACHLYENGVST